MDKAQQPVFFKSQEEFRKWLEQNFDRAEEILVGFYKVGSGKPSMTWSQSVDQALCFGWIDGIRRSIDDDSYTIRFTRRNPGSNWSAINIRKVEDLQQLGLMRPAGMDVFNKRNEEKSAIYSYERNNAVLPAELLESFKSNPKAWENFQKMPASYQKTAIYWVMSAKQESTRIKRLNELITDSEAQRRIKPLSY